MKNEPKNVWEALADVFVARREQGKRFFIVRDERNLSACRSNPWQPLSRPFLRREDANAELPTYVRWYGPCIIVERTDADIAEDPRA